MYGSCTNVCTDVITVDCTTINSWNTNLTTIYTTNLTKVTVQIVVENTCTFPESYHTQFNFQVSGYFKKIIFFLHM